ncbi:hypothetical protein Btru_069989 [Bulinus truncatus]|nr:hypothetical protein Btru_069989 [Bulinus truncatus]
MEDVSVFAFESSFGAKSDGKRRYLVTSLPVFWHYYNQLDPHMRHHYEIIPEGYPCKLFFDLEYAKEMNQDKDGDHMVDILIQYVCLWLKTAFNIACDRSDVLELDASTSVKFSRHLIFQMGHVFENCIIEGQFVRFIFHLLWKFVKLSRQSSLSSAHYKKDDVKKMILEEDDFNSEDNEELIYFTKLYEDIYQTEPNYLNIAENFSPTSVKLEPNSHGQNVTSEIEKMAFDNAAKCPEPDVIVCHNEINIYGDLSDFTSEQLTLFHSFSLEDLSSLLVQNKDGNETLFCDLGVYTKNRNFRLFLSSKLHQSNPLVLSSRNKFQASAKKDINQLTEESIFYSSLVSLQNDSCIKFLPVDPSVATCSGTYGYVQQTAAVKSPMSRETDDVMEGGISSSPFPLIDNFIQSLIKSKGSIYRWTYFKSCNRLVYSITCFRWCWNIHREHKSNNIMKTLDLAWVRLPIKRTVL